MAVPDYQSFMLPLLTLADDNEEHTLHEAFDALAKQFNLSSEDRNELLPSGQRRFENRVGWARTYLKKAGLLESPVRSVFRITPRGKEVLKSSPANINAKYLKRFPEFVEFQRASHRDGETEKEDDATSAQTPEEILETSYQRLHRTLAEDLLDKVRASSPEFFEHLVVELLVGMGYGGSREEAGQSVGRSGDGGIDGIIKEDKLGLDTIYLQAKRWTTTVGRPVVSEFAGSLEGHRARKGVLITTSQFSADAKDYVSRIGMKIVLIDGQTLAQLMIAHNIGVSTVATYDIKKIDSDYFADE